MDPVLFNRIWLNWNQINISKWAGNSPDLNLIEDFWGGFPYGIDI